MKSLLIAFLLALSLSCSSACVLTRSVRDLYTESSPAVFLLETESGHCSSFHVGNGLVLTAAHCIDEGFEILHLSKDQKIVDPKVLLDDDKASDIAILYVPEAKAAPFVVLGSIPSIGERLVTIGFPGYFNAKTIDVGYVIGLGELDSTPVIFGDGNAFPGESGGPVLNERGLVVGIVSRISPRGIIYPTGQHLHRNVSVFMSVDAIKQKVDKVLTER